ncbi:leucyl/phenylalanyl-tRNA--protein transferase [Polyangium sorediatum]|uniref:Leucyl/phenylalanyl-tRNA--protein transferase n=1 Tax=Polyangium sorediatum TaxID=889274 RepID=A0ABT6NMB1_9BACT|nr:leucyl/phenylalanyl-tRNA--protein transferase [Polyangium sorediatum]MDI1429462.1 leucyl/phenylalanyl-tRNA--protein transferase [Polyangium sorediatum]
MSIDADDIVAVGGSLEPRVLVEAYRRGVFPWPIDGLEVLPWFCPKERAVLDFSFLHLSRSLRRELRKTPLRCTVNRGFDAVIERCAEVPRPGQDGTWITEELMDAYKEMHRLGFAHSVEVWDAEDVLVGGIYGVCVEGYFSAESMFHLTPNASKIALLYLVDHLREAGCDWIDIQVMTPHMKALGAIVLTRKQFLDRLARTRAQGLRPFGS